MAHPVAGRWAPTRAKPGSKVTKMHSFVQFVTELREIGFEKALKVSFDTP